MEPFLDALKKRVLVGDGAYGTLLSRRGLLAGSHLGPVLNLLKPGFVQALHQEYIAAGAEVIETNTFGADRASLASSDLADKSTEICRAGAELARNAAGEKAWVLGSVSPLWRGALKMSAEERTDCFTEQIHGLIDGGVDGILLETFSEIDELLLAIDAANATAPDTPLIAQMAFTLAGSTSSGSRPARMIEVLKDKRVDVIGANCGGGETAAIEVAKQMVELTDRPISIYPNRGLADFDEHGRPVYIESSEYFARSARRLADLGVNLIGGCCGTSPEDIRQLKLAISARKPSMRHLRVPEPHAEPERRVAVPVQPTLEADLKERLVVIAEIDPPRGVDASKELKGAHKLAAAGIDAITIADNPLSVMRMSNLALASLFMRELDVRILLHVACRDRNLIGTQSHLLGAYAMGVSNLLAVTGDPLATQAYQGASGVFDMASHKLIEMISRFNQGEFRSGDDGSLATNFFVGAAFNCATRGIPSESKRLARKIAAGARFVMTQPVFDVETARKVAQAVSQAGVPLVLGIMPLISERNADFLHHEVPGIEVPEEVRARMKGKRGKEGRAEGAAICRELMREMVSEVQGFYLITPMGRYGMIAKLATFARKLAKQANA